MNDSKQMLPYATPEGHDGIPTIFWILASLSVATLLVMIGIVVWVIMHLPAFP